LGVWLLCISGGEPFLREDIFDKWRKYEQQDADQILKRIKNKETT